MTLTIDTASTSDGPADVAVIVLTWNQRATTLSFLESLFAASPSAPPVLIWDNGSDDGTASAVAQAFPNVRVHRHDTNLGVASGRNAAAKLAIRFWNPRYLLFLDNDLELEPGFVEVLTGVLDADPTVGQVQGKLRFFDDRSRLNDGGGCRINFLTGETVPVGYREIDRGQHDRVKPCVACGGAMMVRASVFEALGGFDPAFDPFGPEDLDFSLRLQAVGHRALFVPGAVAYHVVSHSFGAGYTEEYARHKARHWMTFLRRHGTRAQKLGFFLLGAPYVTLRMAIRQGRRGNLRALRGIARGLRDRAKEHEGR